MQIQALAAEKARSALSPFAYAAGAPGPHDCLIEIETCGICHSDVHMIDNDWGIAQYPLVPGHEIIGRVREVGREVQALRVGDRVGVGWQSGSCHACEYCDAGQENLCDQNQGTIVGRHGGFANAIVVDSRFCFAIPEGLSSVAAAPLLCAGVTVYCGLKYAGLRAGARVAVIGAGGLGHLAVQFAARAGAHVTVFTSSADKFAEAAKLGAENAVLSDGPRPGDARGASFDLILSTAPVDLDWNAYLQLLRADGSLCLVGVPTKPMRINAALLMAKRRRILSSPIGGSVDMREMLAFADAKGVAPITETFALADANQALDRVRANSVRYRAVLRA